MPESLDAIHRSAFLVLLTGLTLFFLWMIGGFLFPVFWAVVLAILLHPLYARFLPQVRLRSVSALLTIAITLLVVLLPLGLLATSVVNETHLLYARYAGNGVSIPPAVSEALETLRLDPNEIAVDLAEAMHVASSWFLSQSLAFTGATAGFFLQFAVMLYLLFFLLRDGKEVAAYIRRRLPFDDALSEKLFSRFLVTTRATVKGAFVISLLQGAAGGLLFFIAGVPGALLWGVLMAVLALLPIVGPSLVWLPTSVVLFLSGAMIPAAIVFLGGLLIVGPIDTFIRPILVGQDTNLPNALVLLSILGGIGAFGLAGIIIGPVAAALLLASWDVFAQVHKK